MIFEKIRERLNKEKSKSYYDHDSIVGEKNVWGKAIDIVNEVEAEYNQTVTNADRIRQMTDEELAEFLLKVNTAYAEPCMVSGGDCKYEDYPTHDKGCKDCFLEYLRKEVEEKDE